MKKFLAPLAILGLSACGGGLTTAASPTLSPTAPQVTTNGTSGSGLAGTVPSGGGTGPIATITHNGTSLGLIKLSADGSTFGMAEDQPGVGVAFISVAFSDDGIAVANGPNLVSATTIATADSSAAGAFGQMAVFTRDSSSVLPVSGTGTFQGDYRGTIGATGQSYLSYAVGAPVGVKGNVTLNANFNNNTISGGIASRQLYLTGKTTVSHAALNDVVFANTTISGSGQYTGSATSSGQTGTYSGLIGGTNGQGMAGSLSIDQVNGGNTYTELGVFTAARTGN